jgi:pimeloyl-ACP methyl ester carboxylesterase
VWAKQIADLSPRYKIIVADTRGHGQSTRTPGQYSYDIFAADYLALLDYLKIEKAAIVGWSDGGIIGLDIAMKHPERVSKLFAHAANADLTGLKPDIGDVLPQTPVLIRSALTTSYDEFAAEIRELWNREPSWTRAELASIKVPTTIVLGDRDEAITMEHTKYLAGTIPGAQLVILKNAGHAAMLQSPREYSRAVARFMAPSRSLAPWARKNQSKEITTMRTSYQRP